MTDLPPDVGGNLGDDDVDLGEPVTDKLNVLLEELSDEWDKEGEEIDMSEPVTDKLNTLLAELPEDWDSVEPESDMAELVTDRLSVLLAGVPEEMREDMREDMPEDVPKAAPDAEPAESAEAMPERSLKTEPLPSPSPGLVSRTLGLVKAIFRRGGGKPGGGKP